MFKVILALFMLTFSFQSYSKLDSLVVKCPSSNKLVKATLEMNSSIKDGEVVFVSPVIKYRCFLQFKRSVVSWASTTHK